MGKKLKKVFTTIAEQAGVKALGYEDLEADIDARHPDTDSSLLHDAIIHGKVEIVKKLAEEKITLNYFNRSEDEAYVGMRSMHIAIHCKQYKILNLLLEKGVDPNATGMMGKTPLMQAAVEGNEKAINLLLSYDTVDINKANPEHHRYFGMTALAYAASLNRVNIVKLLLAKGAKQIAIINNVEKNFLDYFTVESAKKEVEDYLKAQQPKNIQQSEQKEVISTLRAHSFMQKEADLKIITVRKTSPEHKMKK